MASELLKLKMRYLRLTLKNMMQSDPIPIQLTWAFVNLSSFHQSHYLHFAHVLLCSSVICNVRFVNTPTVNVILSSTPNLPGG